MASYMGTVPIIAGDFSISRVRNDCVFPLFDKSMIASAPSSKAMSTFSHSTCSSARSPEIPKFTFTFVRSPSPTPSGESDVWWMFAGMAMRPAATPSRMNSGVRPSFSATMRIAGVISPARAKSICVILVCETTWLFAIIRLPSLALSTSGFGSKRKRASSQPAAQHSAACELPGYAKMLGELYDSGKGPPRDRRKADKRHTVAGDGAVAASPVASG